MKLKVFIYLSIFKVNKHASQLFHSCLKTKYFNFSKQHIIEYVRKFLDNLKWVFILCHKVYHFE